MDSDGAIGVAALGAGVVGSGVVRTLVEDGERLAHQVGRPLVLRHVLVRNAAKSRSSFLPTDLLTTQVGAILEDPRVDIVVEMMGGEQPARDYLQAALETGKHAVTANKEVMAKHGPQLITLAEEHGVSLLYEASVAGGVPIIGPLMKDLLANRILSLHAIINGTTNYIITKMAQEHLDYDTALAQAQERGYAEADPRNDVEGIDAAYKLAILATLAFHTRVLASDVYTEGIARLSARDFQYAAELGYAIKLLATARRLGDSLSLRVHPALVPQNHLLAKVDGVLNAVEVEGDLVGTVVFHGQGAGSHPTTSAVVADILEVARGIASGRRPLPQVGLDSGLNLSPMEELTTQYYARLTVADQAGVLANIARMLGDQNISIASVIQKEADPREQTAEIVVATHPAREAAVQEAFRTMERLQVVHQVGNLIRVEQM